MSGKRPWGADTVALGRRSGDEGASVEADTVVLRPATDTTAGEPVKLRAPRRPRGSRRQLMMVVVAGLTVVIALASVVTGGRRGKTAGRREVAEPGQHAAAKAPTRMHRRELQNVWRETHRHRHRKGGGRRLEDEREPKASAKVHEPTSPAPEPTSPLEAPAEVVPEPSPDSAPAPSPTLGPTSPAVEFGM